MCVCVRVGGGGVCSTAAVCAACVCVSAGTSYVAFAYVRVAGSKWESRDIAQEG